MKLHDLINVWAMFQNRTYLFTFYDDADRFFGVLFRQRRYRCRQGNHISDCAGEDQKKTLTPGKVTTNPEHVVRKRAVNEFLAGLFATT